MASAHTRQQAAVHQREAHDAEKQHQQPGDNRDGPGGDIQQQGAAEDPPVLLLATDDHGDQRIDAHHDRHDNRHEHDRHQHRVRIGLSGKQDGRRQ